MSATTTRPAAAWILAGILSALCFGAVSAGSAPPRKDPAKTEFYTDQEMATLSQGERDRYCDAMDSALRALKEEVRLLKAQYDSLSVVADTLRNQSFAVNTRTRELNTTLRDLRLKDKAINSYVVKKGETLRKVAATIFADPTRWREIYEANKGAIGPENAELKEGMRLTIPRKGSEPPKAAPAQEAPKSPEKAPDKK